jgi:hypothetical protein
MQKWYIYYLNNSRPARVSGVGNFESVVGHVKRLHNVSDAGIFGGYPESIVEDFDCPIAETPRELFDLLTKSKLRWNDPDPIPGNDYVITNLHLFEDGETALIQYNGDVSEAEIFLWELALVSNPTKLKSKLN